MRTFLGGTKCRMHPCESHRGSGTWDSARTWAPVVPQLRWLHSRRSCCGISATGVSPAGAVAGTAPACGGEVARMDAAAGNHIDGCGVITPACMQCHTLAHALLLQRCCARRRALFQVLTSKLAETSEVFKPPTDTQLWHQLAQGAWVSSLFGQSVQAITWSALRPFRGELA